MRFFSCIEQLIEDLRYIMTALNVHSISDLRNVPLLIKGETHHWLTERGIHTKAFAQRT